MASIRELSPRDKQVREINRRNGRLDADRLARFRSLILQSYETHSVVGQVALVAEVLDREPSGYKVISRSEARSLPQFNDPTVFWDPYCSELGQQVALGEMAYIFEVLVAGAPDFEASISSASPVFDPLFAAASQLRRQGFRPDVLCAPISFMVEFLDVLSGNMAWGSHPRETLTLPDGTELRIFWSNSVAPISKFVLFDSSASLWRVKPDPETGHRLTIAIGEPEKGPKESVTWLAETVVHFELTKGKASLAIPVEG
jgi:hypothetical protein